MLSALSNTFLRALLRVYFVGAFALIALIGAQCCKCSAKLHLLNGRSVRLVEMTGWVRGPDIAQAVWKLRRLPGGVWLGTVMIAASVVSLVADLASSTLVYERDIVSRCLFGQGLVVESSKSSWGTPPPNSKASLIVSNAQIFSFDNQGAVGIYRKVNSDVNFYAEYEDLLGWWNCEDVGQDETYDPSVSVGDLTESLVQLGLLYPLAWTNSDNHGDLSTHAISWSSSQPDDAQLPFTVKASIDQGYNFNDSKLMKSYTCSVDSNSPELDMINSILSEMASNSTLQQWVGYLPSYVYDGSGTPASDQAPLYLAQSLNSMTMVEGGNNILTSTVALSDDPTQGCIVPKTYISPFVIFLILLVGLTLVGLMAYWIILLTRLGANILPSFIRKSEGSSLKPIPDGLLSWMLQATRETSFHQQQNEHGMINLENVPKKEMQLRDWNFTVVQDPNNGRIARLVRPGEGVPLTVPPPQMTQSTEPAPYNSQYGDPGVQWEPKQDVHYTSVPIYNQNDQGY